MLKGTPKHELPEYHQRKDNITANQLKHSSDGIDLIWYGREAILTIYGKVITVMSIKGKEHSSDCIDLIWYGTKTV